MLQQRKLDKFKALLNKQLDEMTKVAAASNEEALKVIDGVEQTHSDWTDVASMETQQAIDDKIRSRELTLVVQIQEAIRRIENKTFGECVRCGEDISEQRLVARPITTLCIDCKAELEGANHRFREH